jgi:hypothetical protein
MRRVLATLVLAVSVAGCSSSGSSSDGGYEAPDGPGDPTFYNAIQFQYDQGDCEALASIIQGWQEPPADQYAESYIDEAEKARAALGCM